MEFKSKLINTKDYKRNIKLNKKMKKKAKKYEGKDFSKLSMKEQYLFGPLMNKNDKTTKNDVRRFFRTSKYLTLLYLFPKSEVDNICPKFVKMFVDNPMEKNIFSTIIDSNFESAIKQYNNYSNHNSYTSLGHIQPKKIKKYVDQINIITFNFSNNYYGVSFECVINDETLNMLNGLLTCDIEDYTRYKEYYVGNQKQVGRYEWNPDILREEEYKNTILEIKCEINNFLNSYLEFEKKTKLAPISLNIYKTNYKIEDRPPAILRSFDMYEYTRRHLFENMPVCEFKSNSETDFLKLDACFGCYKSNKHPDRSNNLIIKAKNNKQELYLPQEDLINIYINILFFHKIFELEELIADQRNNIFSVYSNTNKKRKIYKMYNDFSKNILKYESIISNVSLNNSFYINDYLKKSFSYQEERREQLLNESKKFEKYFDNKLNIEAINSTRTVSFISIFIALVSVGIALIPIINDNSTEKKIDEINNTITNQTDELKKANQEINTMKEIIDDINKYLKDVKK